MKLKTVEIEGKKYAVMDEQGLPVYVHNDGKEVGFDAVGTTTRISALNREAQTHRENYEAANGRLKAFEGIEDPAAAHSALQTVANLKAGDLKTAAQVEEIRQAAQRAAEQQVQDTARQSATRLQELERERDQYRNSLFDEKVGGAFSRSKFITDRTTTPPDMLRAMFGGNFKVEDGKIVPYGADGNKIYSRTRAGEVADFEEGIEFLIDAYPHKSSIYKGTGNSGSGAGHAAGGGGGGGQGGKPQMTRQAFEALGPAEKGAAVRSHQIVDADAA